MSVFEVQLWVWTLIGQLCLTIDQYHMMSCQDVSISAPVSVMRTVCSNWADLLWSGLTAVHLSSSTRMLGLPSLTPGSIVKVIPGNIRPGYEFLRCETSLMKSLSNNK